MIVVETFKGRCSPFTGAPVVVELMRQFIAETLQEVWALKFSSGCQVEYYDNLSHSEALRRFKWAMKWWE